MRTYLNYLLFLMNRLRAQLMFGGSSFRSRKLKISNVLTVGLLTDKKLFMTLFLSSRLKSTQQSLILSCLLVW